MDKRKLIFVLLSLSILLSLPDSLMCQETNLPQTIRLSVLYFHNTNKIKELDWLRKGLADMLISDIATTKKIQVVQREGLQKVLKEQKLFLAGVIDDKTAVKVGNLVGANVILSGHFSKVDNTLRIDAQLTDVEKGTVIDATSVAGSYTSVLFLEKKLSLQLLDMLNIELTEEERIAVTQMETNSVDAAKYTYEAVNAIDNDQLEKALELYRLAMKDDPYYRKPKESYNLFSRKILKGTLLAKAMSQLERKQKECKIVQTLFYDLIDHGYEIQVGELKVATSLKTPNKTNLSVPITISLTKKWLQEFNRVVTTLKGRKYGYYGDGYAYSISNDRETRYYFDVLLRKQTLIVNLRDEAHKIILQEQQGPLGDRYSSSLCRFCWDLIGPDLSRVRIIRGATCEIVFRDVDIGIIQKVVSVDAVVVVKEEK